jgi:hypothetical protein
MPHDVFISYSSRDKPIADAVTATLEQRKIRCWVAPRDVLPGVPYGESIIDALKNSRAMVLIFSASANTSPQVMREVERAVSKGVAIIPFRIEDVTPSKSMEYFISAPHWLDAWNPPMEQHTNRLAEAIQRLLGIKEPPAAEAVAAAATPVRSTTVEQATITPSPPVSAAASVAATITPPMTATPAAAKPKMRWWMIVAGLTVLLIIVAVALRVRQRRIQRIEDLLGVDDLAAIAKPEPSGCSGVSLVIQRGVHGAVADAYIWAAEPDGSFNYDTLYTGMYEAGIKQSLIRFDLQEIPRNAQVQRAILHILFLGSDGPRPVRVHRITREWAEERVTWDSFASQFDREEVWAGFESGAVGWRGADITGLVQAWVSGSQPNFGLLLDDLDGKTADQHERYLSSEAEGVEMRPWLEVCYKP